MDVIRSSPQDPQDIRLLAVFNGLSQKFGTFVPDVVSIERVFAQENRNTVLGTAQAAGLAMVAAAQRGIPVALHTPTEAKMAVTGNGQANKAQVQAMVAKILSLNEPPSLALAICHALRPSGAIQGGEREQHLTAAQKQWTDAVRSLKNKGVRRDM